MRSAKAMPIGENQATSGINIIQTIKTFAIIRHISFRHTQNATLHQLSTMF